MMGIPRSRGAPGVSEIKPELLLTDVLNVIHPLMSLDFYGSPIYLAIFTFSFFSARATDVLFKCILLVFWSSPPSK